MIAIRAAFSESDNRRRGADVAQRICRHGAWPRRGEDVFVALDTGVPSALRMRGVLQAGHRVVLQRIQDRVEVTVREVEVRDDRGWLWPRSTVASDTASILPVEMPWPPPESTWRRGDDRFIIAGIVVQALTPELGRPQNAHHP